MGVVVGTDRKAVGPDARVGEKLGGARAGAGLKDWAGWEGIGSLEALLEFTPHCSPCSAVYKFQARPWPPPRFSLLAPSVAQPPSQELRVTSMGPRASLPSLSLPGTL